MGYRVSISGGASIELNEKIVQTVEFISAVPSDSNARTSSLGVTMIITGKILTLFDGTEAALAISDWSRVPAAQADCYRSLKVEVISATSTVREYTLDKVFVVDYEEDFDDEAGVGTFTLVARQKKDHVDSVKINGGF